MLARNRRRTLVAGTVAAVAALIAGAAILATGPSEDENLSRAPAKGSPVNFLANRSAPSPSGLDAQLYCTGKATPTGSPCDSYHPYDPAEDQRWTIEVTQEGRSALFDVRGTPFISDFDEDSLLVQDGTEQAVRFRLLQADGTSMKLRLFDELAPALAGPDVVLIQALDVYRKGSFGSDGNSEHPYLVDDRNGTLQRLDVPPEIEWWGPNVDEFLWGGDDCRAFWQQPDGSFDHHDVDCKHPGASAPTDPGWNSDYADWLQPGRMAMVESNDDGEPLVVHASLDRGATWEQIDVEDPDSSEEISDALSELMRLID